MISGPTVVVQGTMSATVKPLRASLSLNTPMKTVDALITADGVLATFTSKASLNIDSINIIDAEVSYQSRPIRFNAKINNPLQNVAANMVVDGSYDNFATRGKITVGSNDIEGDMSFTISPLKATLNLKTPIKTLSSSFSAKTSTNRYELVGDASIDDMKNSLNMNLDISKSIEGSAVISVAGSKPLKGSFSTSGRLPYINGKISLALGNDNLFGGDLTLTNRPLAGSFNIESPFLVYKKMSGVVRHDGDVLNFGNHFELVLDGEKTEGDFSFNFGSKFEVQLSTRSPFYSPVSTGLEFNGNAKKFQIAAKYNDVSLDTSVNTINGLDALATIKTPFNGYKTITGKMSYSGTIPNIDASMKVNTETRTLMSANGQMSTSGGISMKAAMQSIFTPTLQLTFDHSGNINKFNTNSEFRLNGNPYSASVDFKSSPLPSGSISVNIFNKKPITALFNIEQQRMQINANVLDAFLNSHVTYQLGDEMELSIEVTSSFSIPMKFVANLDKRPATYEARLNALAFGRNFQAEGTFNRKVIDYSLTIKTPYGDSDAHIKSTGAFPYVNSEIMGRINGRKASLNTEVTKNPFSIKVTSETPFNGFENIGANFNFETNADKTSINSKVNCMNEEISADFEYMLLSNPGKFETKFSLETPYTEDLKAEFSIAGIPTSFVKNVAVTMGEENTLISSTTFSMDESSLNLDCSLKTLLAGYADEQKINVAYNGHLPNFNFVASSKVLGSYYSSEASLTTDNEIIATLKLNTPARNIELNIDHSGTSRRFTTKSTLQFDGDKIIANLQYSNYGWRRVSTAFDLSTPFTGFEAMKASYRHSSLSDGFECDADLSFMGKDLSATLTQSNNPMSASITINTPFSGFQKVGADGKLLLENSILNAEANIAYMQDKTISGKVEINSKTALLKINTPFLGYENAEARLSFNGEPKNFQSQASVTSSFLPSVRLETSLRYVSALNVDGSVSFTSQINNFERIDLTINNKESRGKYTTKTEFSWAPSKSIILSGDLIDDTYRTNGKLLLSTPFQSIRNFNMDTTLEKRGTQYSGSFASSCNGQTLTDFDLMVDRKALSMTMRSPVTFTSAISGNMDRVYQGSASFSKDINVAANGVNVKATYDPAAQKLSLNFKSPTTTVNLDGAIFASMLNVNGEKYGYEVADKSVKIMLPSRTLQVTGVSTNSMTEGYFLWDADRDSNQKIGFRSAVQAQGNANQYVMTLMMPSIGKVNTIALLTLHNSTKSA